MMQQRLALLLLLLATPAHAKVVGVWTDIEGLGAHDNMTFIEAITQATAAAHTGGLRFAVDAQVGWGFESLTTGSTRPTHMDVMDIVDEITIMDYFAGCNVSAASMPQHDL